MAKNLRRGLVYGNAHSVIGLLCACFDFALNDNSGLEGVFTAVRDAFRLPGSRRLLDRISSVNDFRNTYIAHHEKDLADKALAESNLKHWVETLSLLKA
jgi:type III restriction enzyme